MADLKIALETEPKIHMSEGVAKTGALYLLHIFRDEGRNVHLTEKRIG